MADEAQVNEREAIEKDYQAKVDALNATRTGVGTRAAYGFTRGKGSIPFVYEKFDESKPDTLPKSFQQFMDVTGVKDEAVLTNYLISGRNEELYTTASDPIAEYVEPTWSDEVKNQFRLVVRNYARGVNGTIEDAVALIKPGFVKGVAAQTKQ